MGFQPMIHGQDARAIHLWSIMTQRGTSRMCGTVPRCVIIRSLSQDDHFTCMSNTFVRKAHSSACSSMRFVVGLPPP